MSKLSKRGRDVGNCKTTGFGAFDNNMGYLVFGIPCCWGAAKENIRETGWGRNLQLLQLLSGKVGGASPVQAKTGASLGRALQGLIPLSKT